RVQYTSATADVGRVVSVVWTINRPFLDTTAETITIASHLDGVLTLPANTPMANVRLDTAEAFPDNPASIAELVTPNFQTGLSAATFTIGPLNTSTTFSYLPPGLLSGGNSALQQTFALNVVPSASGQVFTLDLPNSAESSFVTAAAIPEPNTFAILGF